jgi:hypothetical protein
MLSVLSMPNYLIVHRDKAAVFRGRLGDVDSSVLARASSLRA